MLSLTVRFALIVASAVLGVIALAGGTRAGWLLLAGCALLTLGLFAYGTVWLAFRQLRRGDLESTRKAISQTLFPRLLTKESRAYRSWILGALAAEEGDLDAAVRLYAAAAGGGLRTTNDRAAVHVLLASVEERRGNQDKARGHLASARRLPHRPALDEQIQKLAQALGA